MISAKELIQRFGLEPHPEGGYYKRTHFDEHGSFSSIIFLLVKNNFSAFHRIQSDEQWNWYYGDAIIIHEIEKNGDYHQHKLSNHLQQAHFQHIVRKGNWFASECIGEYGFALCGCTVIPAFSFEKFELAKCNELVANFPRHHEIIKRLTRKS
ncbi:MAG TPA: cupin domain-containing protein [Chitinophagales bacterium]|nr:cupin domain-containing protein [Chitinophagales bacterium]HMW12568.1 cupin domain-containing protein [Chitinophagales bacterium]HMY22857.1 cupin domain-containing protein [Chitinophagales bacterium]HMZ33481.1 cupin domain-containing protein [Chitinophagales bacterium]HNA38346.1 cupin domain-containing protein [Chitinophagales bacterium]